MAKNNLTEDPVWRALTRVSAPMSLGILAVLSIGLADPYFLRLVGGDALAAIGCIYPVITALVALSGPMAPRGMRRSSWSARPWLISP